MATLRKLGIVIVDLSHEIAAGVFAGSFGIGSLSVFGNIGTCLDAPYHYDAERADLAHLPLERLVNVSITIVHAFGRTSVTAADLGDPEQLWGRAVLVHTGWAHHWATPRYLGLDCPHLAPDAVDKLVDANAALVGIDSLRIDDPRDPNRLARQRLLGADIPIIEHLTNLESVPDTGARLTALPPPAREMASFPVRAVAVHDG
ncbi:cyclase family protein [Dactylosporangium darangshiense]|uniref:Cyclase family protein n=1 Tax=Dactylosporangium darangshiense TaxID=579108 RepID=A0ABP8DSL3_9ACTN